MSDKYKEAFKSGKTTSIKKNIDISDLKKLIRQNRHHLKFTKSPEDVNKRRNIKLNIKKS